MGDSGNVSASCKRRKRRTFRRSEQDVRVDDLETRIDDLEAKLQELQVEPEKVSSSAPLICYDRCGTLTNSFEIV